MIPLREHDARTSQNLLDSPADWISPNGYEAGREASPAHSTQMIVLDTGHTSAQ